MKKIGIYVSSFQPPAKSHYEVYRKLKALIGGDEVFVATTDREPIPDAPLNFGDKEQIWVRHGVPASHIIKISSLPTDNPEKVQNWKPEEIYHKFPITHTVGLVVLNEKEAALFSKRKGPSKGNSSGMSAQTKTELTEIYEELATRQEENPQDTDTSFSEKNAEHDELNPVEIWLDPSGKPLYFQPYRGNERALRPLEEHAYVVIMNDSKIDGSPVSTSNIRVVLGSSKYKDDQKKKFFRWVFGWFDVGLYQLMTSKFKNAHQVSNTDEEPPMPSTSTSKMSSETPPVVSKIQEMVYDILKEYMDEDYSSTSTDNLTGGMADTLDTQQKSMTQQKSDAAKQKTDLVKSKKELEAKSKQNKQQRDNYNTTVRNYDQFQKKTDRDALNAVNKQLSQPIVPTSPIA